MKLKLFIAYTTENIDQLCLRSLGCPDSFHVKNGLKEKDKLLPQSIEWIIQDPQYRNWQDGDDICLLWIKGGAGKGKTMISIGLIERLLRSRTNSTAVTYFFCQNANYELNSLEAVLKGLILQLINQQMTLKESLRRRWNTVNGHFNEDVTSWRTLWNILLEMLDRCNCSRVYMIVDALDECQDGGMTDFLRLIVRNGLDNPTKIKWLLTSRPLDSAERELLSGRDQVQVNLELNSKHISGAVQNYIHEKLEELDRRARYGKVLKQELKTELTIKAENTFLWVSLVCKELEIVPRREALATLQSLPLGLHPIYDRILNQLSEGERSSVQRCIRLLKVMILAYRPLKVEEASSVIGLTDEEDAIELFNRCASFIRMQGNNIEFVHQSARDYLAGEIGQSILESHEHFGHKEILLGCLSHLSKRLKVNIMNLPRPDSQWTTFTMPEVEKQQRYALLDSVEYTATYWVQHLREVKKTAEGQSVPIEKREVGTFLQSKLLEWLECLSLLDKLPLALDMLKTLVDIFQVSVEYYLFV